MPRVRPRSNVYALMPILATIIMVGGIALTWTRISQYLREPELGPRPKVAGPAVPNVEPLPKTGTAPATATPSAAPDEFGRVPGTEPPAKGPGEVAPTEKAPTEKAPDEGGVAPPPPATKGPAPGPAVAPVEKKGPAAKADEEEKK
jgi:hypothetical protein